MLKIKMGERIVQLENQFHDLDKFCARYRVADDAEADFTVCTTEKDREKNKRYWEREQIEISEAFAERDQIQHNIYIRLPEFGAFWLHACVVEVGGEAYAFSAPPGYGKTTHATLWKRLFGENARIINGDNPVIQEKNGRFHAYGTPWCGKEGWSVNIGVPLRAVCYIEHNDMNSLERLDVLTAYRRLIYFSQQYQRPENLEGMLSLYERFAEQVSFYQMNCNMDLEAARIAFEGMSGRKASDYEVG